MSDLTLIGPDALLTAIQETPRLQLNFYSYGIILRKHKPDGAFAEYAVDPAQIAAALAIKQTLATGLLTANTLYFSTDGTQRIVAEYRPPQLTGIFLEDTEKPVRVPMPGMVMVRLVKGKRPEYRIFAVHERPTALSARMYSVPLPNMSSGTVCWGSVRQVPKKALESTDLAEDWKQYLGSPFNAHAVHGKSVKFPKDIRLMLFEVENQGLTDYPVDDLLPDDSTLGGAIKSLEERG